MKTLTYIMVVLHVGLLFAGYQFLVNGDLEAGCFVFGVNLVAIPLAIKNLVS